MAWSPAVRAVRLRHLGQQRGSRGMPLAVKFLLNLRQRRVGMRLPPVPQRYGEIVPLRVGLARVHRRLPLTSPSPSGGSAYRDAKR